MKNALNMKLLLTSFLVLVFTTCFGQSYSKSWKDINYAGDKNGYHNMDIYLPVGEKDSYPVVITIYGSAWLSNNSKGSDMQTLGKALLNAGFAVVMPNHRASFDTLFPAQIHDMKAVVRYIRANAQQYNIDTSFVGVTGSSSGGNMASMIGATRGIKAYTLGEQTIDLEGTLGSYTDFSSSVDAVVAWFPPTNMLVMDSCGGTDFTHNDAGSPASLYIGGPIQENKDKTLLASPTTYINANTPPFLIFHGTSDRVVPYCQSQILYSHLQQADIQSQLVIVEGGQHGPGVQIDQNLNLMVDFFKSNMKTVDSKKLNLNPTNFIISPSMLSPQIPSVDVTYTLSEQTNVSITVFDTLGHKIEELCSGLKEPGIYSQQFNAKGLHEGTYFVQLRTNNSIETKKVRVSNTN
jgi:acetyl esterase/lipase